MAKSADVCARLLSKVQDMMGTVDAARLTQEQYAQIESLKADLENACAAGDNKTAERTEQLIVAIIKEGPPAYE